MHSHGDLTINNIGMYRGDIKFIDPDTIYRMNGTDDDWVREWSLAGFGERSDSALDWKYNDFETWNADWLSH